MNKKNLLKNYNAAPTVGKFISPKKGSLYKLIYFRLKQILLLILFSFFGFSFILFIRLINPFKEFIN